MRTAAFAVIGLVLHTIAGGAQQPVFRAGVDLVTVDAIVVDGDGRPITGFTADDFAVSVDGKPRAIDAFELVAVRALDGAADRRLPDVSSNDVAEPGRLILLVVDRNNIRLGDGRAALAGMQGLVNGLSPRDRLGLITLPGGGPVVQPTSDHAAVLEALGHIRGMESLEADPTQMLTMPEAIRIDRRIPGALTPVIERNCGGAGQQRPEDIESDPISGKISPFEQCRIRIETTAGRLVRETRATNMDALAALETILESMREVDARKTIIYVSHGVAFDTEIQGRLRQVGSAVAAAGATFYAIQLYTPPMQANTAGLAPDWDEDRRVRAEGLSYLAGVSGGALFRPGAGLSTVAARIARETSARYAIGFQLSASERDGKRHTIKVALRRERGVTVRHRTEFVAELRSNRFSRAPETLAAALSSPVMLPAVPIRVATSLIPDGSAQPKVLLAAAVGPPMFGHRPLRTRIAYEVIDLNGKRVTETEEVESATPVYTVALRLKAGRYRLRLAAKDEAGRIGSVEHAFEVSAPPPDGLHVGGALIFRDIGRSGEPQLLVDVPSGRADLGVHLFVAAAKPALFEGVSAVVDVANLDEQVSHFNGPLAVTCIEGRPICEYDTSLPATRWPEGRYRADVTLVRGTDVVARASRPFNLVPAVTADGELTSAPTPDRPASLSALLERATAYVDGYANRAVSTVAEEHYVQAIFDTPQFDRTKALEWRPGDPRGRGPGVSERRQIGADLLMVKTDNGWFTNYRDVSTVDGKPVKDRNDRALALFTSGGGAPAPATLARVAQEGARHNLGSLRRTINVPTLPLFVLHPRHVGRFAFEPAGTETIDGTPTTIVRFTEKRGPTFIQTPRHDDVFTNGRLWIAADGRVLQTALRVDERDTGVVVPVSYTHLTLPTILRV